MKVPLGELLKDSRDWRDRNPTDLHWNGRSIPALGGHVNRDGASAERPSPRPGEGVALLPLNDDSYLWISQVAGNKEKALQGMMWVTGVSVIVVFES